MEWRVKKPEEMKAVAEAVLASLDAGEEAVVLALSGELGAGKTTFVQCLGECLGLGEHITSPTFVIQKRYQTDHPMFTTLLHIDAYRLEDSDELGVLGWYDALSDPHTLVAIEWPENVQSALPDETVYIRIEYDGKKRKVTSSNL